MVPGLLRTVTPFLIARPDLGLICTSCPSGISIIKPVGIKDLHPGINILPKFLMLSGKLARRSAPDEPVVAYFGIGIFSSAPDVCLILRVRDIKAPKRHIFLSLVFWQPIFLTSKANLLFSLW